jgi:carbon storage regulator CsrA
VGRGFNVPALTLSRCVGEAVVLAGLGITVRILEVRGKSVRFAVEAPPGVPVFRSDLAERPAQAPAGRGLVPASGGG